VRAFQRTHRIIPGMNQGFQDGRPSTVADGAAVFRIRFGNLQPRGYVALQGDAELAIGADEMQIRGRARRLFGRTHEFVLRVPLASIRNTVHEGLQTYLEFVAAGQKPQRLVFSAADPASAEQIALRIPARQTEEFGKALADVRDFRERLLSVSPTARVTPVLIGLNVAVFLVMAAAGAGIFTVNPEVHVLWGSNFGPRTVAGEWWRLLTSIFVHFGVMHLLLNMWVLRLYGELAERLFGTAHYLALYLFAGIAGSLASLAWHPEVNSAGASGAIFGIFGGMLAFVARRRNRVPASIMVAHRNSMLAFVAVNLLFGFVYPGIDNAAHLGGLAAGFVLGLALGRPVDAQYRSQHGFGALIGVVICSAALLALAAVGVVHLNAARQETTISE
jgi:rhomboid protease GluP